MSIQTCTKKDGLFPGIWGFGRDTAPAATGQESIGEAAVTVVLELCQGLLENFLTVKKTEFFWMGRN